MRTSKQKDSPKTAKTADVAETPSPADDRLIGVPGLGPARITALHAAGITTRAALAQSSVEQLVSMTGMQRSYAEKALAAVRGTGSPATTPAPPTDEMMPDASVVGAKPDQPEPTAPEPEVGFADDLQRAVLTLSTALAEATQRFPDLDTPLTKLARRLQKMPQRAESLSEKKQAKIAASLDQLTARLEKAIHRDDITKASLKKLREHIEEQRDALKE